VTGGKPKSVLLQSISGVSVINLLVAFYDIHGGKGEVLFFYFVPDTSRENQISFIHNRYLHTFIELDDPTVRALSVRLQKLSNVRKGQSSDG
jgi:hypothetical protein